MRKLFGVITILLVFGLTGCLIGGPGKVTLYVDDQSIAEYKIDVQKTLKLDIPTKEGMMFTGWNYGDKLFYDEFVVPGNADLYATWEDPIEVFGFNESPNLLVEFDGKYITSYSGDAVHLKIPAMVDGEYIKGIQNEVFKGLQIKTVILPMDIQLNGSPFIDSEVERVEFYGEYQIPKYAVMPMTEFDQIIIDFSDECILEEGATDESWKYMEGCPIQEVIRKTDPVIVGDSEFFSYEVFIDRNVYTTDDATQIATSAFLGAYNLKTVEIPYNMDRFFQFMFEDCFELEHLILDDRNVSYKIKDGIVYTADETMIYFYPAGLKNETYELPDNVTDIHIHAFLTTTYLKTLVIHEFYDENLFFFGAESLEEIIVEANNEKYQSVDGVLFEDKELIKYPASKIGTSYVIPEGTTMIGSGAFMDNYYLEEVNIPSTVTEIGSNAFWKSKSITTIDIPSSVTLIHQALAHESNITTIIIRRDMTIDDGITRLIHLLYGASEIERTIYVPDASFIAYSTDEFWRNHIEDLEAYQTME